MTGHLSHLRQRIELPLDLQSADVDEGLWLQPRCVQNVVAVDQKAVELPYHLERAAKGNTCSGGRIIVSNVRLLQGGPSSCPLTLKVVF